jgi:hypothetical protein
VRKETRTNHLLARLNADRWVRPTIAFGVVDFDLRTFTCSIPKTRTFFGKHVFSPTNLFITVGALIALAVAQPSWSDDWILRKQDVKRDIEVFKRKTPEGLQEVRIVTHVNSRMSAFVAVFGDVDRMPAWVHRTSFVKIIEQVSDTESYAYTIHDLPWPFRDRDSVVRAVLTQDADDDALTIRAHAVPDYYPRDERYIRMPVVESFWRFTPLATGRVRVEFQGYGDPGGGSGVLQTLRDNLAWTSTYKTVRAFREVILSPEYQAAQFPFVREPR